ncbi:MAG: Nif11-like leader peptide family natural product precursor [Acidobacteria bacterium]|nr:Nif11-like leader peptide family natural product precursor [Acidobacteriota bacterium]
MSHEHAKTFLDAIDQDPELYKKMSDIRDQMQQDTMALAKQYGYDVTPTELKAALEGKLGTQLPGPVDDKGGAEPSTCFVPFSEAPGR